MRILAIAVKDVLITFRDKKALVIIIAMPLVLIAILGAAFGQVFKQDNDLGEFKIAVVDHDGGTIAKEIKDILGKKEIKKIITTEITNETNARRGIKDTKYVAALIIPQDLSRRVVSGENVQLEIIADPGKALKANIFKGIMERFASGVSGITIAVNTTLEQLPQVGVVSPDVLVPKVVEDIKEGIQKPVVQWKDITTEGNKKLSSFQYYSAAMGVMFIMFSGMFGIKSILEERDNRTLMRMMSTTTSKFTIVIGKFMGILFTGFIQVLIMIISTSLIFGVHWGTSYLGIVLMSLTSVFAASGLSMFIASLAKTERSAEMMASIGIQVMSLIGGSMVPVHVFPEFMKKISNFTLNKWSIVGFNNLMLDKGVDTVIQPSLALLAFGAVLLIIGVWRLRLD